MLGLSDLRLHNTYMIFTGQEIFSKYESKLWGKPEIIEQLDELVKRTKFI